MNVDVTNLPPTLGVFATFLGICAVAFQQVWKWTHARIQENRDLIKKEVEESTKQLREEHTRQITELRSEMRGLEERVHELEGAHKTVAVECGQGLILVSQEPTPVKAIQECFNRILGVVG